MAKSRQNTRFKPRWHAPGMDDAPAAEAVPKKCAVEGCDCAGEYPAPRSRESLRDYQWMCLEHVKAHNAKWDFLKGMNAAQIEEFVRQSTVGDRPTRPLGIPKGYEDILRAKVLRDFGGYKIGSVDADESAYRAGFTPEQVRAFKALALAPTRDFKFIKERYRKLAKQFHPDANGGSSAAEDKLKVINEAYSVLKSSFAAA